MPCNPGRPSRPTHRRLRLEGLEDRSLPSGFAAGPIIPVTPSGNPGFGHADFSQTTAAPTHWDSQATSPSSTSSGQTWGTPSSVSRTGGWVGNQARQDQSSATGDAPSWNGDPGHAFSFSDATDSNATPWGNGAGVVIVVHQTPSPDDTPWSSAMAHDSAWSPSQSQDGDQASSMVPSSGMAATTATPSSSTPSGMSVNAPWSPTSAPITMISSPGLYSGFLAPHAEMAQLWKSDPWPVDHTSFPDVMAASLNLGGDGEHDAAPTSTFASAPGPGTLSGRALITPNASINNFLGAAMTPLSRSSSDAPQGAAPLVLTSNDRTIAALVMATSTTTSISTTHPASVGTVLGSNRGLIVVLSPGNGLAVPSTIGTDLADSPTRLATGEGLALPGGQRLAFKPVDAREGQPGSNEASSENESRTPASRAAELIASFSPFEAGTLERAIDQFLGRLGELDGGLTGLGHSANLVPSVLVAAVAISVAETVRRRWREPWENDDQRAEGAARVTFPGLPARPECWALEE